ncbi:MAG: hypothetical protein AMXMBFR34_46680 [Myxococcaceae bacterium]
MLLSLLITFVTSAEPPSTQVVAAAAGVQRVPGSLLPVGDGFVAAWSERSLRGGLECHLARLDGAGQVRASRKIEADQCEGVRAAWSGERLGVTFRADAKYQPGRQSSRAWFQRFDAALELLGPKVEVVDSPAQTMGFIVWNPRAEEWAVAWTAFEGRPGAARLTRFSLDGRQVGSVGLATGTFHGESWSLPLASGLAVAGRGYRVTLGGPLRVLAWEEGGARELANLGEDGFTADVLVDGESTWVAWESKRGTVLHWARLDGVKPTVKTVVREVPAGSYLGWVSLLGGGKEPLLMWHELAKGGSARACSATLPSAGQGSKPSCFGGTGGGAYFPTPARDDGGASVLWMAGAEASSASAMWLRRLP